MSEIWKPIVGYVGYYEVSNLGNVHGVTRTLSPDRLGRIKRIAGKPLCEEVDKSGYVRVTLSMNGDIEKRLVHRSVLEAFVGPCPDEMEGCHRDNNPGNNRLDNLKWDTRKANQADRVANGTSTKGSGNGRTSLLESDVASIKRDLQGGSPQWQLAAKYGVSKSIISAISTGKTWKEVRI